MLTEQTLGCGVHHLSIQRPTMMQHHRAAQRVPRQHRVTNPVPVVAPQRRESGIKIRGNHLSAPNHNIAGQHPGKTGNQRLLGSPHHPAGQPLPIRHRNVHVRHLSSSMHPRISPPGHNQPQRCRGLPIRRTHHPRQPIFDGLLNTRQIKLTRPPGISRPVITQVQTHTNNSRTHPTTLALLPTTTRG